jgi:hypothetical protein
MTPTGFEPISATSNKHKELGKTRKQRGTESGTLSEDLTLIIEAWPKLSEPIRAAMIALVKAAHF